MEFKRIVAVTGMPGLFEVVSSKNDGALVRNLEDKTTKFVSSRVHNMSHLESIEVYTSRDNVQLTDVFAAMQSSKEKLPDLKDNNSIKSYFEKVYPELDFERVYPSDMKKMVKWYSIIDTQKIDFTPEPAEDEEEEEVQASAVKETKKAKEPKEKEVKETKEAKEPKAAKETTEKKATAEAKAPEKKTAAKKTAAKKTSEKETEDKPKKTATKKKS